MVISHIRVDISSKESLLTLYGAWGSVTLAPISMQTFVMSSYVAKVL